MLYPVRNAAHNLLELSGLWDFQTDPEGEGEARGFMESLPDPRPIAVPGSWNEQYAELFGYFGPAWHLRTVWLPESWSGRRIFLRVGSANYRATAWVNGRKAGEHEGGHLPFVIEITESVRPGAENTIALMVENLLLPERVPSGGMNQKGVFTRTRQPRLAAHILRELWKVRGESPERMEGPDLSHRSGR